jgi:hypothetical protein
MIFGKDRYARSLLFDGGTMGCTWITPSLGPMVEPSLKAKLYARAVRRRYCRRLLHIGENSPEYVAFRLMLDIAKVEKKALTLYFPSRKNAPVRSAAL